MGSPFQSQSVSGFNSSPPADDGSTVAANKIAWATIKQKLADPLNTFCSAINSALRSALNISPSTTGVNYTTVKADHLTTVEVTGTTTISLGDAASMIADGVGYAVSVYNKGVGVVTVNLATVGNALNGTSNGTYTLQAGTGATFGVNQAGTGYYAYAIGGVNAVNLGASALGQATLLNGALSASVGSNVLTVAIKTKAGADPSPGDPVYVLFRSATPGTGDYTVISLIAATSIATTVGGTFGVANSVAFRLWLVGFNDAGTFRLSLINCLTTVAGAGAGRDVTAIFALNAWGIASATQVGAGSTSAGVFYSSGAAVTSKAYTTLGYLAYESGLATSGSFASTPTRLEVLRAETPLPGQIVQVQRNDTGAVATGTTTIPRDDTPPQSTEGDQYMTQAITPSSAANVLKVSAQGFFANSGGALVQMLALFQDATANAIKAVAATTVAANFETIISLSAAVLASTTSATTFKLRSGGSSAGTTTFNGASATREFGGVGNSFTEITEIMG